MTWANVQMIDATNKLEKNMDSIIRNREKKPCSMSWITELSLA
jgi:hypothetical protein